MKVVSKYLQIIKAFIIEAYAEFKKVTWPTKQQTYRLTAFVIGVSLGVGLFIWAIDLGLKELLAQVLIK